MSVSCQVIQKGQIELAVDVDTIDDEVSNVRLTMGTGFTSIDEPSVNIEIPVMLEDLSMIAENLIAIVKQWEEKPRFNKGA